MSSLGADCDFSFTALGIAGAGLPFLVDFIRTATRAFTNVI
jgi:hypothetical protein